MFLMNPPKSESLSTRSLNHSICKNWLRFPQVFPAGLGWAPANPVRPLVVNLAVPVQHEEVDAGASPGNGLRRVRNAAVPAEASADGFPAASPACSIPGSMKYGSTPSRVEDV